MQFVCFLIYAYHIRWWGSLITKKRTVNIVSEKGVSITKLMIFGYFNGVTEIWLSHFLLYPSIISLLHFLIAIPGSQHVEQLQARFYLWLCTDWIWQAAMKNCPSFFFFFASCCLFRIRRPRAYGRMTAPYPGLLFFTSFFPPTFYPHSREADSAEETPWEAGF